MFDKLERRIGMFSPEPALRDTVRFLVLHHLRANQYDPNWTDSAVRRFARELGAHLDDLLCLARADITTKRPEKKRKGLNQIEELAGRIAQLAAEDAKQPPLPSGIGDAVMKAFGIPPSRQIGEIKKQLEDAIASGEIEERLPSRGLRRVHRQGQSALRDLIALSGHARATWARSTWALLLATKPRLEVGDGLAERALVDAAEEVDLLPVPLDDAESSSCLRTASVRSSPFSAARSRSPLIAPQFVHRAVEIHGDGECGAHLRAVRASNVALRALASLRVAGVHPRLAVANVVEVVEPDRAQSGR